MVVMRHEVQHPASFLLEGGYAVIGQHGELQGSR
jgi:hypothetical protein